MAADRSTGTGSVLQRTESDALTAGSARALLFTVLGELVWPSGEPVRTATLVSILTGLGVEEQTARQAIARAAASGWIDSQRLGREVSWSLTPRIMDTFVTGSARVFSLTQPYADWDGRWLVVLPTIPQSLRKVRRPLYAGLGWAGFGDPAPGVWVTPHVERADEIASLVGALGLTEHTVSFVGTLESIGIPEAEVVRRGWDLAPLSERYEAVLAQVSGLHPSGPDEPLLTHIRMMNACQEFPRTDPQLPEALLPDWIGRRVSRRIEELRQQWAPATRRRYAELNAL